MPMYCCIYGCKNDSELHPDKHFHQFPSNKKLKTSWIQRVNRDGFTPSKYTYVCSDHFLETDYSKPNPDTPLQFRRKGLKRGTIPSVNLKGSEEDERVPRRHTFTSFKANCQTEQKPVSDEIPSTSYNLAERQRRHPH